jgi:hypothetical protein
MQNTINESVVRLKEISAKLKTFSCDQSSLVLIETLFFETLSILRTQENKDKINNFLEDLLRIKDNEYKQAQAYYKSLKAKEKAIRLFRFYFKKVLDGSIITIQKLNVAAP